MQIFVQNISITWYTRKPSWQKGKHATALVYRTQFTKSALT